MGTVKYSGPVASFHCPTEATIRSLKVHFSPKQEGSGDPSPENVRPIVGWEGVEVQQTGKNIGHIVGYSATTLSTPYNTRNITNSYGTSLNTIEPERSIVITQSQAPETSTKNSYKNGYFAIEFDNLLFGESYDISFKISDIKSNPLNATLQNLGIGGPSGVRVSPTEIRDNLLIYKNVPFARREQNPNQMDFDLRICGMSFTLSDFMIAPANTSDSIYEPYHGSTTNYEFGVLGKNKFDYSSANIIDGKRRDDSGNEVYDGTGSYTSTLIPVFPSMTYTASGFDTIRSKRIYYIDTNETLISRTDVISTNSFTFTTPSNCHYIQFQAGRVSETTWSDVQLELGDIATTYEPYNPNHTVYGGWVDLITGEVCETHHKLVFDGTEQIYDTYSGTDDDSIRVRYASNYNEKILPAKLRSTQSADDGKFSHGHYSVEAVTVMTVNRATVADNNSHTATWAFLWLPLNIWVSSSQDIVNYIKSQYDNGTPLEICYPLATPNTYTLAPTQLQTFLGQNNVWSNADYVEVEYDLHETQNILARKQFIMANQPHIVKPAAAPLQNFVTDMAAPLRECKVHFRPVQEGTGDPSPDNVRPISGWTGIEVMRSPKNIFPKSLPEQLVKGNWSTGSTSISAATNARCFSIYIGTNRTLKFTKTGVLTMQLAFTDLPILDRSNTLYGAVNCTNRATYTLNSNEHPYLGISIVNVSAWDTLEERECILRFNETPEGFEARVDWEPIPIDWTDSAGTIYGGYVDLVSGEVWKTHDIYDLGSLTWGYNSNNTCFVARFTNFASITRTEPRIAACSHYKYEYVATVNKMNDKTINDSQQLNLRQLQIHDNNYDDSTLTDFQSTMTGIKIIYLLSTPTLVTTLTPTALKTLRGTNNVWSNSNGDVTVQFWKH